jgi:hypothetical protein
LISAQAIDIRKAVDRAVAGVKITDVHTHLYTPDFGPLLLWGVDELLSYHYLVAETLRWLDMPYYEFWGLPKREQADLIWQTLFIDHSPYSEACRGVLTVLDKLGLDVASRDLRAFRGYFDEFEVEDYVDKVFEVAGVESVVMTNDPFDDLERPTWPKRQKSDRRFHAALRLDGLINSWETACPKLKEWGYNVHNDFGEETCSSIRRFLGEWIDRMGALYMAVSLPPTFAFPEESPRGTIIEECVLPVARDKRIPLAMMIGVKKLTNPGLRVGGDSVGKGNIDVVEYFCANYPDVKFMVTMLSRENQHECAVAARKFRNLMIFGCWWFLNNPSLIDEITRMRFELLGVSVIPQHSDARVLDQLIYKWTHSRRIIADVLVDKYNDIAATGWTISEDEIHRDVADLFGGNFWKFVLG